QPRQRLDQAVDEATAQPRGGQLFQLAQVEQQPDDREVRMQGRANIDGAFEDAHAVVLLGQVFRVASRPADARRVCRLKVAPAMRICTPRPSMQTGSSSSAWGF